MSLLPVNRTTPGWTASTYNRDPMMQNMMTPMDIGFFGTTPFEAMMLTPFEAGRTVPYEHSTTRKLGSLGNIVKADIVETPTSYCLEADLPGIRRENLDITVEGDFLVIKGERRSEHDENTWRFHRHELEFGKVERNFRIPDNVDVKKLLATFENGVLKLTLPKVVDSAKTASMKVPIA